MSDPKPPLLMSRLDVERIESLLESPAAQNVDTSALEAELERATIIEPAQMPPDVITMNSTVRFVDLSNGEEESYILVYPRDADAANGKISVFAPIGTALLGYRVDDVVEWSVPAGKRRLQIVAVQHESEPAAVA